MTVRLLGLILIAGLAATPQVRAQTGVIHSESRLVLVDTVVTDKKGNFVDGLTQSDFKVFEDNKEQAVVSFSRESESGNESAPRYTVLFFDNSTAGPGEAFAREAAVKFIESNASPGNLMAVAEYSTSLTVTQNFTSDVGRLRRAVASAKVPGARGPSMPAAAQAAQDNDAVQRAFTALQTVAKGLSSLPGRKALILVSAGFPDMAVTRAEMAATVSACNKANVAIYPVGSSIEQLRPMLPTGGTVESPPATGNSPSMRTALRNGLSLDDSSSGSQQALTALASGTGGFVISNTGDLLSGLLKVAGEQRHYYLLGYVPSAEPHPGACHVLKVRVEKGGNAVRSRSGYCESVSLDALAGTPAERDLDAKLTGGAQPNVPGALMQAPFFYTGPDAARVNLVVEVPPAALSFAREKGKLHAVFNIVGVVAGEDGTARSRFSDAVNLEFDDPKQADAFSARPFRYEKQFPMLPGKYTLSVIFSGAPNRFGKLEAPLAVEPWNPGKFLLSPLALGDSTHAAEAVSGFDAGLVEDRVPLVANGFEVVASGSNRVKRSGRKFVYAEVYEPALAAPGAKEADVPAVGIRMQILDAAGAVKKDFGLTRLRLPPLTGKTAIPVGLVLTAPDLAPGPYSLRVSAMDAKGNESARTVPIQLEN